MHAFAKKQDHVQQEFENNLFNLLICELRKALVEPNKKTMQKTTRKWLQMSSIESMISEIEGDYDSILKSFEKNMSSYERHYRFDEISEDELLTLTRSVMKFQRKLEHFLASIDKLAKETGYKERLKKITGLLFMKLSSEEKLGTIEFWKLEDNPDYLEIRDLNGVITELKRSHRNFLHRETKNYRRSCFCAYFGLKSVKMSLIEVEEELRLIGALTTHPIKKQIMLKNQLVVNGFEEVAVSLEEAESNVEAEHFKDCLSRCRDAVEIFVASIREKETGEKTERHFATDLGKTVKIGIFDVATQRLAQGVYSFLSVKGSHKYDAKKVSVYDAETSLKETYSLLEMLLKRYLDLRKSRKTPK